MKQNAGRVCNDAIMTQFRRKAVYLTNSACTDGWLAPKKLQAVESISQAQSALQHLDLSIKLLEPGPQYLCWLSKELLRGHRGNTRHVKAIVAIRGTENFLKEIHGILDKLRRGKTMHSTGKRPKQKELLWYYGAPPQVE